MKICSATILLITLLSALPAMAQAKTEVVKGSRVTISYVINTKNGKELTRSKKPLSFTVGQNNVLPYLQKGMLGMKQGEQRKITLTPDHAFGPVNPKLIATIPLSRLPKGGRKVGAIVSGSNHGRIVRVRVIKINGDKAVIDGNHPWAGKTLVFHVHLLKLKPPAKPSKH